MDPQTDTPRRTRRTLLLVILCGALVMMAAAVLVAVLLIGNTAWIDEPIAMGPDPVTVTIERGMSARGIGRVLVAEGLLPSERHFLRLIAETGGANRLRAGVFQIQPGTTPRQMIAELQRSGNGGIRVTLVEGWTSEQMGDALIEAGLMTDLGIFRDALASSPRHEEWAPGRESLEGYLYPDTYLFVPGMSPEDIVAELTRSFERAVNLETFSASAEAMGLTVDEAVILASIIQREARTDDEMPIMAGVFLNRLGRDMKLESCATVHFAIDDWSRALTIADTEVDHPYNTYEIEGLPPGPICNPGLPALRAAVSPADTDYLFFVYDEHLGYHRFSRTFAEHRRAIREARQGG